MIDRRLGGSRLPDRLAQRLLDGAGFSGWRDRAGGGDLVLPYLRLQDLHAVVRAGPLAEGGQVGG
jgi:hypothetical protein